MEKLLALSDCFSITLDELVKDETANQEASEAPLKSRENKASKVAEMKVGIGLCLIGAICLILSGVMMVTSPSATDKLNAASTITLNGSGILLILCVLELFVYCYCNPAVEHYVLCCGVQLPRYALWH